VEAHYFAKKPLCKLFFYASSLPLLDPLAYFWRSFLEWLCTVSTKAETCSGGVNWLMP
jgi:hypothetical protein